MFLDEMFNFICFFQCNQWSDSLIFTSFLVELLQNRDIQKLGENIMASSTPLLKMINEIFNLPYCKRQYQLAACVDI